MVLAIRLETSHDIHRIHDIHVFLFFLRNRLDVREHRKADQPGKRDGNAVTVQHLDPWLAQRHDAEDHGVHGNRLEHTVTKITEVHEYCLCLRIAVVNAVNIVNIVNVVLAGINKAEND